MDVEIKKAVRSVELCKIKAGSVFKISKDGEERYIKSELLSSENIRMSSSGRVIIVNLKTGGMTCPLDSMKVFPVKAKVICDD